jgi:hypothetical protein
MPVRLDYESKPLEEQWQHFVNKLSFRHSSSRYKGCGNLQMFLEALKKEKPDFLHVLSHLPFSESYFITRRQTRELFSCSQDSMVWHIDSNNSFIGCFSKTAIATISFVMSVRPSVHMEHLGFHWTDFHEICYVTLFENLLRKLKFRWSMSRITGTLHEEQYWFLIMWRSVLWMRNISGEFCKES